ncbi:hypothetical protein JGG51_24280, partial [Salmonella enterica subsp. enterica serovar Meleagridis]|nr:hypothetical protein [Salmonella enterica subsp. enterica serovar Meleagridis]
MSSALVLAYPRPDQLFILDSDASNTGTGTVLSQVHDGQEKVIAYFSSHHLNTSATTASPKKSF